MEPPLRLSSPDEPAVALRAPEDRDIDTIVAYCRDPDVVRWTRVPAPYGPVDAAEFLAQQARDRSEGTGAAYLIVAGDDDGEVLGSAGVHDLDGTARSVELGYLLAPWGRGRGAATAAVRLLSAWALQADMVRLYAEVVVGNDASERVLERAGFQREGVLRSVWLPSPTIGRGHVDVVSYSLVPGDAAAVPLLAMPLVS
jgi:RimJ/RimL family protein N-acetyltransferase